MREIVGSQKELEQAVFDYKEAGWEVDQEAEGRVIMERGFRGGFLEHFLFFLVLPIYGNLVYSAYRRYDRPEKLVLRVSGFSEDEGKNDSEG